jgi:hypothetical protein
MSGIAANGPLAFAAVVGDAEAASDCGGDEVSGGATSSLPDEQAVNAIAVIVDAIHFRMAAAFPRLRHPNAGGRGFAMGDRRYAVYVQGLTDNEALVLELIVEVVRSGERPTVSNIAKRTVPKNRTGSIVECLESLVLTDHLVRVDAGPGLVSEERRCDLYLYYPETKRSRRTNSRRVTDDVRRAAHRDET